MRVLTLILISLATACTTDAEPTTPSCDDLGADPAAPLLCDSFGSCTYNSQVCERAPRNTLADRKALCGDAPIEPEVAASYLTDSHGDTYAIVVPSAWDGYAAYMDASKAWADCMVYAQPIAAGPIAAGQ